jgi:hypothetical protein
LSQRQLHWVIQRPAYALEPGGGIANKGNPGALLKFRESDLGGCGRDGTLVIVAEDNGQIGDMIGSKVGTW